MDSVTFTLQLLMFKRYTASLALVATTLVGSGCGTIIQGTSQEVSVSSNPSGAAISINGQQMGTTPASLNLSRKDRHTVRLDLSGYQPYEMALSRGVSGWVWGNIVFGGIPGLAIDAISGGMYKLTPEQVTGEMRTTMGSSSLNRETLYIAVVMTPNPEWEQIGQLVPAH